MAAHQQQQQGPIDQADVDDWKNRFNEALANTASITGPAPADARDWQEPFFGCFTPLDTCCITWCLPCVTFGKTHHRSRKDAHMHGYNFLNTSCLMFAGFSCFGLHCIPILMQRADVRKKYNLKGDFVTDFLTSWCCGCCSLVQQDKEVELREKELGEKLSYKRTEGMAYAAN